MYADTPLSVTSFIELCQVNAEALCDTEELKVGFDYEISYTQAWATRLIFENDNPEENIIVIEYT